MEPSARIFADGALQRQSQSARFLKRHLDETGKAGIHDALILDARRIVRDPAHVEGHDRGAGLVNPANGCPYRIVSHLAHFQSEGSRRVP